MRHKFLYNLSFTVFNFKKTLANIYPVFYYEVKKCPNITRGSVGALFNLRLIIPVPSQSPSNLRYVVRRVFQLDTIEQRSTTAFHKPHR